MRTRAHCKYKYKYKYKYKCECEWGSTTAYDYGLLKACELRSRVGENQIDLAMLPATSTRCTGRLPGLAGGLA